MALKIFILSLLISSFSDAGWVTEDIVDDTLDGDSSFFTHVTTSEGGVIYGSAITFSEEKENWLVRGAGSNGESWKNLDFVEEAAPWGIASNANKDFFAVGSKLLEDGTTAWFVRKGGVNSTPSTVLSYQRNKGQSSLAAAAVHLDKDVIVVGRTRSGDMRDWTTMKSSDGGKAWEVIDFFTPTGALSAMAYAVTGVGSSEIFVGGTSTREEGTLKVQRALIRVSLDGGKSWTTPFESDSAFRAIVRGISSNPDGSLIAAVGSLRDSETDPFKNFLVASKDHGKSWKMSWIPATEGAELEFANTTTIGINGDIYVGLQTRFKGDYTWVVKKSNDLGGKWTFSDFYQYNNETTRIWGISGNPEGEIFGVGHCGANSRACSRRLAE